jgi:hypothetical protein
VSPAGKLPRKRQELPSSWGTPIVRLHMIQSDSGRTARTRPLRCSSVALGTTKAKAPTKGLSKLNSMAFGLAVYASPGSLPHHDARLTSGCWSGATGRAFHPQGSYERFQICILTSHPPFPSFAWRNVVDLGSLRQTPKSDSAPSRHVIDRMTPVGRCLNRQLPVVAGRNMRKRTRRPELAVQSSGFKRVPHRSFIPESLISQRHTDIV